MSTVEWDARQCAEYRKVSVSTWTRRVRENREPQPIRKDGRKFVWDARDVCAEWTAQQCADHRGITVSGWNMRVRAGTEPKPLPKRLRKTRGQSAWNAKLVRDWTFTRKSPDEWDAEECAAYRGVTVSGWRTRVRAGHEPQPIRKMHHGHVWNAEEVRAWKPPSPYEEGEWSSQQCADHRGVSLQAWSSRVKAGTEPEPTRKVDNGRWAWNAEEVRTWQRPLTFEEQKRPGEWTAQECAAYRGISVGAWNSAVTNRRAPRAVRKVHGRRLWDAEAVRAWKDPKTQQPGEWTANGQNELWEADAIRKPPVLPREKLRGEWDAQQCAEDRGIDPQDWWRRVHARLEPQPVRKVKGAWVWDAKAVRSKKWVAPSSALQDR